MTEGKHCTKCGVFKERKDFSVYRKARDGLAFQCKQCAHIYYRKRHPNYRRTRKSKEERRAVRAAYRIKNRELILSKWADNYKKNREVILGRRRSDSARISDSYLKKLNRAHNRQTPASRSTILHKRTEHRLSLLAAASQISNLYANQQTNG